VVLGERPWWRTTDRPVGIDLFSGAGGFSLGFHQAGWHVVAAVELDAFANLTYAVNLGREGYTRMHVQPDLQPKWDAAVKEQWKIAAKTEDGAGPTPVFGSGWISSLPDEPAVVDIWMWDAHQLTGKQVLESLELEAGQVDCVFGGPPCQGFSTAGLRDVADPRSNLVYEFARLVVEMQPKTLVMENVPGILSMYDPNGLRVVDRLCRILADGGMGTVDSLRKSLEMFPGSSAMLREEVRTDRLRRGRSTPSEFDDEDEVEDEPLQQELFT
jgi:DNA (cytosine-5)-methyltransferase 1